MFLEMVLFLAAFVFGCTAAWIIQAVTAKKAPQRGNAKARRKASRAKLQEAWAAAQAAQVSQRKKAAAKKRRP